MSIARYGRRSGGLITGISFLATLLLAGCGGGSSSGGDVPTAAVKITGTAAKGAPITSTTITLKDKNGTTATGTTGADGKFTIDATLTPPLLLRISTGNGYLYSVATAEGTTNIHPYTDLIIKNWYLAQGSNVETEFNSAGALTHIPTASEINTIEAVISSILSANMSNAGVSSGFNLITGTFDANSTGFDKVLDSTQVVIDTTTGGVTVTATDATTGITGTIVSTSAPIVTTTDTTKPTDPTVLAALPASISSIVLTWTASTDNVGVAGYNIYRGGSLLTTSPYPVYTDTSLTPGTNYCYQVEAFDGAGNKSAAKSTQACATVPSTADTTAPSTPTILSATAASSSKINLSWTISTDNVIGYAVYRDGVKVTTVTGTSFSDAGLATGTTYTYTVKAVDSAMHYSPASASASATTSAGLPTAPTGIAAAAADGQTSITWNAVGGATSYNLYWSTTAGVTKSNGTKITSVASPYTHTGRTNGTTYYYVITAVNASGESAESAQASATPVTGGGSSSSPPSTPQTRAAEIDAIAASSATVASKIAQLTTYCTADFLFDGGMSCTDFMTFVANGDAGNMASFQRVGYFDLTATDSVDSGVAPDDQHYGTVIDQGDYRDGLLWRLNTSDNKYYLAGNQLNGRYFVYTGHQWNAFTGSGSSYLATQIQATSGITAATLSGPGLNSTQNFTNNMGSYLSLDAYGNTWIPESQYALGGVQTGVTNQTPYVITLFSGASTLATYKRTLLVAPLASGSLTAGMFATVSNPPSPSDCNGSTWIPSYVTPTGYIIVETHVGCTSDTTNLDQQYQDAPAPSLTMPNVPGTVHFSVDISAIENATGRHFTWNKAVEIATMKGHVYMLDGVTPIEGAVITTSLDSATATTDASGYFSLVTTTAGNGNNPYTLTVTATGYQVWSNTTTWGDHPIDQVFTLAP